jgi:hypothetical protein
MHIVLKINACTIWADPSILRIFSRRYQVFDSTINVWNALVYNHVHNANCTCSAGRLGYLHM